MSQENSHVGVFRRVTYLQVLVLLNKFLRCCVTTHPPPSTLCTFYFGVIWPAWVNYCPEYHSGLAGPWNRGIIAHQTPHSRRPPKHVNNKGPLVFAQTFCTACFISLENLHIYSKTYVFSNTFEGFRPKCTFRGCLSKYQQAFIVYMFRRPPEVWSLISDNALISGTGKVGIVLSIFLLKWSHCHCFVVVVFFSTLYRWVSARKT